VPEEVGVPPFRRILIANRGEIALRIIRTCRRLGIETVVAASAADRESPSARAADRVLTIGPPPASASYLNRAAVISAAKMGGCDGVHPGYGFLAESVEFAEACAEEGITFIGPRPEMLRLLGDKVTAREAAMRASVPLSGGSHSLAGLDDALETAEGLRYPILLKPVRGGGGKGMRVVNGADDLRQVFHLAETEARAAFGDGSLYMERWVANARHVEVQVAGDGTGSVLHFGDRDCSVQRRQQKLVEEAPAPGLDSQTHAAIAGAAVDLCRTICYDSIGTVEFLFDADQGTFTFLEVNPRIQVEHGVTELITGVDLVELQIRLAAGEPLPHGQDGVSFNGVGLEVRINAEDPELDFRPSPGRITAFDVAPAADVRVDTQCEAGYSVPPFYDSLVAKVMTHAATRSEAVRRMDEVLAGLRIEGIATTRDLARWIVTNEDFLALRHHTRWLDQVGRHGRILANGIEPVDAKRASTEGALR
jgi:acetyl-CoA carboxylase biotin carboxylase subunit